MLAAKCALAIRVDALGEETNTELGLEHRAKLEYRMKRLEDKVCMLMFKYCARAYRQPLYQFSSAFVCCVDLIPYKCFKAKLKFFSLEKKQMY